MSVHVSNFFFLKKKNKTKKKLFKTRHVNWYKIDCHVSRYEMDVKSSLVK